MITGDLIFFFEEITRDCTAVNIKQIKSAIGQLCQSAAAVVKTAPNRVQLPRANKDWTQSNALTVKPERNIANSIAMQWSLWLLKPDPITLENLLQSIESLQPDLKHLPASGNKGVIAFFEFGEKLQPESATELKAEIEVRP